MAITFDRVNKIIEIAAPSTEVSIQLLLNAIRYWEDNQVNLDIPHIASASGKETLGGGTSVGVTLKLLNGWRVKFADRLIETVCNINGGNLVAVDELGNDIFPLAYSQFVLATLTSSSSATLQELSAIQYSSFNNGVTIDAINGSSGITFPSGTAQQPVDNLDEAVVIALANGFKNLYFIGNFTFGINTNLNGYHLIGERLQISTFTFIAGASLIECELHNATVTGDVVGVTRFENCRIYNYGYSGFLASSATIIAIKCLLDGEILLPENFTGDVLAIDCCSGTVSSSPPILNMNNALANVAFHNYSGMLEIVNYLYPSGQITINLVSGKVILDSTITDGTIKVLGVGVLESEAVANIDITGLVNPVAISNNIMSSDLDDGISTKTGLQAILSTVAGLGSGGGTESIVFRNANNTSDRVTMIVDNSGNRSLVTINPD